MLAGLPSDTPAALAAFPEVRLGFTRLLCERLRTDSRLHIRELTSSDLLTPGSLHVAPAQHGAGWSEEGRGGPIHIEAVKLMERSKETAGRVRDSCSRAIEVFGPHICAVLLSGMADDSVEGARLVKEAGGMVVVQNEATALVWDGPQEAIRNGLADDVLPLWAIGGHLAELAEG